MIGVFFFQSIQYYPNYGNASTATSSYSSCPLEINGESTGSTDVTLASILTKRAEALFMVGEYEVSNKLYFVKCS